MKDLRVSLVIPAHNASEWLPHAVSSCFDQTYKNCEVVIVDDGSTDSTPKYLKWLGELDVEQRKGVDVVIQRSDVNIGISAARNLGNRKASGDVICVLDADDYCHPDRAKKTVDAIKKGAEYVYGSAEVMDVFGKKMDTLPADVFNFEKAKETLENSIVHSSVGYTKGLALKYPYSEEESISKLGIDDWSHQITLATSGVKMEFIPSVIVAYRQLRTSVSNTRDRTKVTEAKKRYLDSLLVPA